MLSFPKFTISHLRGLRIGESIQVYKESSRTAKTIVTAAIREDIKIKQQTLIVIDPVSLITIHIITVTKVAR